MAWIDVLLTAEHPCNVQTLPATIPPKSALAIAVQFVSVDAKSALIPVPPLFSAEQSRRIDPCPAEIPAPRLSCARQPITSQFSPATKAMPVAVQPETLRCKNAPARARLVPKVDWIPLAKPTTDPSRTVQRSAVSSIRMPVPPVPELREI